MREKIVLSSVNFSLHNSAINLDKSDRQSNRINTFLKLHSTISTITESDRQSYLHDSSQVFSLNARLARVSRIHSRKSVFFPGTSAAKHKDPDCNATLHQEAEQTPPPPFFCANMCIPPPFPTLSPRWNENTCGPGVLILG